jgi:serine/threonine protein kinase
VAIKIVRLDLNADPGLRLRFVREANTLARLSHPGVTALFDAGELDELPEDQEDARPTPEQLAAEAEIVARFGAGIEAAADEREDRELSEKLYRRVARHPGALQALDSVGRAVTAY